MQEQTQDWFQISDIDEIDSPALLVFPSRVKQNIDTAISMVGEVEQLRPHVKTHKSVEITRMLIDAGIGKFKCATIAEAEMLGICKAGDVVLAYQPVGPKIKRFINVILKYPGTQYGCLVDNRLSAETMSAAFKECGLQVDVYIDFNPGMDRTGIKSAETAYELYLATLGMQGIRPVGLQVYDGHLRDPDLYSRIKACDACFAPAREIQRKVAAACLPEPVIIAGGSTTFSIHSKRKEVECSPGTFIYWDKLSEEICAELPFVHAALLITRVVSLPAPGKICVDLGHKSVAAENGLTRRVHFFNAPELLVTAQNEEHMVLTALGDHSYAVGDVLYGIPYHICPTVALYESVYAIEENRVSGIWKNIARDRKINC